MTPAATPEPPASDLMPLLGFDAAALAANRQGELSAAQRDRLRRSQRRLIGIGLGAFFGLALAATLSLFTAQTAAAPLMSLVGLLLTLINALLVGLFARQWLRLSADLRGQQVEVLSGQLERVIKATGRMNNFILRIEGHDLAVNKEIFKAFQHQARYRVYRTRHSQLLLSAEPE